MQRLRLCALPGIEYQKGPFPLLSSESLLPGLFQSSSYWISFFPCVKCLKLISQHEFSLKHPLDVLLSAVLSHVGFPHPLRKKAVSKITLTVNPSSSD